MIRRLLARIGLDWRAYNAQRLYYEGKLADRRRLVDQQQGTIDRLRAQLDRLERDYATLWARDVAWAENNVLKRPRSAERDAGLPFDKDAWARFKKAELCAAAPARDDFQWALLGYWQHAD